MDHAIVPAEHELAGSPAHAVFVHAQYLLHVFVSVPQLPHDSVAVVPGMHPSGTSPEHAP